MATTRTNEPMEMLERWKAEHPELLTGGGPSTPAPRPRLVTAPPPPAEPERVQQREMIERWEQEHRDLAGRTGPHTGSPAAQAGQARDLRQRASGQERSNTSERRVLDIANTPLTVLSAFVIGCILGGIAMTIVTGIAFWGFSGG